MQVRRKLSTKFAPNMDREVKYWLLFGFVMVIFAWVLALASCMSRPAYTMPDGTMVELPKTPTDTQKGGVR